MAGTKVDIANSAAYKIGTEPIMSFEDGTKLADYCTNRYDQARKTVLRAVMPNFAKKRVTLSPETTSPAFAFTYQYALPSDFLRLITNDGSLKHTDVYELEGHKLLFNSNVLNLVYIQDIENVTRFDSLFVEALACYMAWDSSYGITKSRALKAELWTDYSKALSAAKTANAQEQPLKSIEADTWLHSRHLGTNEIPNRDYD